MTDPMVKLVPDPNRFQSFREPLRRTIGRTLTIALALGSIGTLARLGGVPGSRDDVRLWIVLVLSILWFSFGGHWLELAYLNLLRPRIAWMTDRALVPVRLGVWLVGGTVLVLGAAATFSILLTGQWPDDRLLGGALMYGGLLFIGIELVPHTVLSLLGRPSFWNHRG